MGAGTTPSASTDATLPTAPPDSPPEPTATALMVPYLSADGRSFEQLTPEEQLAVVNGRSPTLGPMGAVLLVWLGWVGFLLAIAWPYI